MSAFFCRFSATAAYWVLAIGIALAAGPALAEDKPGSVEKTAKRAGKFVEKTAKRSAKFVEKTAKRTGKAIERGARKVEDAVKNAF